MSISARVSLVCVSGIKFLFFRFKVFLRLKRVVVLMVFIAVMGVG